jgi:hypothetical protein
MGVSGYSRYHASLPPLGRGLAWAAEESTTELAKKTQNPVADLISVPFQSVDNGSLL